ncbi:MAG: hypothetical protein HC929_19505, partial [Leptolyngbyaceae cyanobacterium SM2_5_2]|nr:hypothetical protein [Leptolyngbyaceae cyanobacterium SM2_5_2]
WFMRLPVWPQDASALVNNRPLDHIFVPGAGQSKAQAQFNQWQRAVERAKHWAV